MNIVLLDLNLLFVLFERLVSQSLVKIILKKIYIMFNSECKFCFKCEFIPLSIFWSACIVKHSHI